MSRESTIFRDRGKLSPRYIPERLPHRERQIEKLLSVYEQALDDVENFFLQVTQIVGDVGTGKTCTVLRFGKHIEEEANRRGIGLKHVYVNGKIEGTSRYILYRKILGRAAPAISTRSLSPEEMLFYLLRYLRDEKNYLIISFDEIDYFCKRSKEHVVYDLTRLNEVDPDHPCHVLGVIFIARNLSFYKFLEPSELSTLGRGIIDFPRYTSEQIRDILLDRVELAFKPGRVVDEILDFVSDVAAEPPINGDVRVALDLLLYAGNLAENLGFQRVLPDHVRRVYGETYPGITTEDILSLDEHGKLLLLGLARALYNNRAPYVGLREIREAYRIVCEEHNIRPVEELEERIQDLVDRGVIELKSLTKIGLSNVAAEDLERFLKGIIQRLRGV
ncbi:MAG: Cdc6/Cdc18 family protein [Candidatus Bathyarchaeia archaeon]